MKVKKITKSRESTCTMYCCLSLAGCRKEQKNLRLLLVVYRRFLCSCRITPSESPTMHCLSLNRQVTVSISMLQTMLGGLGKGVRFSPCPRSTQPPPLLPVSRCVGPSYLSDELLESSPPRHHRAYQSQSHRTENLPARQDSRYRRYRRYRRYIAECQNDVRTATVAVN